MLTGLFIQNFVIIDSMSTQFKKGLTVFTGETGVGKSILLDALGFVLGGRSDSRFVRLNTGQAEITATFSLNELPRVKELLQARSITAGNELILCRIIMSDGRSRAFINDRPSTIQGLREIGQNLLDICTQNSEQLLLKKETQLALLDGYAGHGQLLEEVQKIHGKWQRVTKELAELGHYDATERKAQEELLTYQFEELANLGLHEGEWEKLEQQHKKLLHAKELLETAHSSLSLLDSEEGGIVNILHQLQNNILNMQKHDSTILGMAECIETALINAKEIRGDLLKYAEQIDLDQEFLTTLDQRTEKLHGVARKYGTSPSALVDKLNEIKEKLSKLKETKTLSKALEKDLLVLTEQYQKAALELSASRKKAKISFSRELLEQLALLGMPNARFHIECNREESSTSLRTNGIDRVTFQITTNKGQPLGPLSLVASGGELSRLSLAIHLIAKYHNNLIMVLDEVDSGIGGAAAQTVGNMLHLLAKRTQVLCVTHLAQIASVADNHFCLTKLTSEEITRTQITELDEEERVKEIARMLAGITVSEKTHAFAKEMLQQKAT